MLERSLNQILFVDATLYLNLDWIHFLFLFYHVPTTDMRVIPDRFSNLNQGDR